jgi:hypothetical protein
MDVWSKISWNPLEIVLISEVFLLFLYQCLLKYIFNINDTMKLSP